MSNPETERDPRFPMLSAENARLVISIFGEPSETVIDGEENEHKFMEGGLEKLLQAARADSILALSGEGEPAAGWVMVPREPTQEMLLKGCEAGLALDALLDDGRFACERRQYAAMLAAAPLASQALDEPGKCDHPPEKFCELCEPGLLAATKSACDKIIAAPAEAQARVEADPELADSVKVILTAKRECSVCDGYGVKATRKECGGCGGTGEVYSYPKNVRYVIGALLSSSSPKPDEA